MYYFPEIDWQVVVSLVYLHARALNLFVYVQFPKYFIGTVMVWF